MKLICKTFSKTNLQNSCHRNEKLCQQKQLRVINKAVLQPRCAYGSNEEGEGGMKGLGSGLEWEELKCSQKHKSLFKKLHLKT